MKAHKNRTIFFIIFLLFAAIPGCRQGDEVLEVDSDKRVSDVSQLKRTYDRGKSLAFCFDLRLTPKEDVEIYGPFLDYLEKETGLDFALRFSREYEETIENLGTGKAQFGIMGGLSFLKAEYDYEARMLVKGLDENKKGDYRSAIIARMKSKLNKLSELKGRSFAFGSQYSTQGYLIPRYMLEKEGVCLTDLKKYIYTGSHWECARLVIKGEVSAGGIQDTLAFKLEQEGSIKILALSDYYPRSGVAVNKDVPAEIREKVKTALLRFEPLGKDRKGLIDWSKSEMPGGFTTVEPGDYDVLRKMAARYDLLGP